MSLVQIDKIPPLRQSTQEMMSCPNFYATVVIDGNKSPGGMESARGTEIHQTMAQYLSYCALHSRSSDLEAFDRFSRGAGTQAAKILAGLRDGFEVDFAHLVATELTLSLDENFNPTDLPSEVEGVEDSGQPSHFQGTLDGVYLFGDQAKLRIDDFKSHASPFDADTPQGREYAALAFQHFPWAHEVTFRLIFVRYRHVMRETTYTRDQLPALIEALTAARERQKKIHADVEAGIEVAAIAGSHCWYCPLLRNRTCPIAEHNANLEMTLEERLNWKLWNESFSRANTQVLKSYVQETGRNVVLKDFNGKAYSFGPVEKESEQYPVFSFTTEGMELRDGVNPRLPIIDLLFDYAHDNEGDSTWMRNLTISSTGLKKYLKTNKRAFLDQAISDNADKFSKVSLRVSKPLDAVPEEEVYDDDEEFDEEL